MDGWDFVAVIATTLLYGLALYNCYHILAARQSPAASLSWIWAHLTLPFLAVPLYWIFGAGKLKGYPGYHHKPLPGCVAMPSPPLSPALAGTDSEHSEQFERTFAAFGSVFQPSISGVSLLEDGASTFQSIFTAIQNGRCYILVQYYILRSDRLGLELKTLLLHKAKQGVRIFLLYDNMGSFWLSRQYLQDLQQAGVTTASFLPLFSLKRFYLLNYRNHRKIVVVDGQVAFTGGLNIGEEYASSRFNRKSYWRDTHVRLAGPCVAKLEAIFAADWLYATGQELASFLTAPTASRPPPPEAASSSGQAATSLLSTSLLQKVQVIPSGPHDQIGILLFLQLIHSAKKRLWVSTPYFIPDEGLQKSLELAVLRGVDVRLLLPRKPEQHLVHWVTLSYGEQMQRLGVKILLYEKGFIHQKVILIDDDMVLIGTSNFDNRTLYLNFELMLAIFGLEFNKRVATMLARDFSHASALAPTNDKLVENLVRLRANSARLLAPLL